MTGFDIDTGSVGVPAGEGESIAEVAERLRDSAAFKDMMTDMVRQTSDAVAEHLEYELRGAWRAGYDYVHVYDPEPQPLARDGPPFDRVAIRSYVYPTNQKIPPKPHSKEYRYTYDLTAVPNAVIREMIDND